MDTFIDILKMPFTWGLLIGLVFFGFSFINAWKTNRELVRYKRMLNDKMELEAETLSKLKNQKQAIEKENENLRMKIHQYQEKPDAKIERELEILARAEKTMMVNAPGFAPAWETAKTRAQEELREEDAGKSLPKRLFRKFFGSNGEVVEALPSGQEFSEGEEKTS